MCLDLEWRTGPGCRPADVSVIMGWNDHYILDGHTPKQVDFDTWAKWLDEANRSGTRKVMHTVIDEGLEVSTVFTSHDLRLSESSPPILFETMIFRNNHGEENWRYYTWEEAEVGHQKVVTWLLSDGPEP